MKKTIILSLSLAVALAAQTLPINVINAGSLSAESGGAKSAIDAYSDGGGVLLTNSVGSAVVDNSPMNTLVFKYGSSAKANNVSLINEVKAISTTSTAADKELADKLLVSAPTPPVVIPAANNTCAGGFQGVYDASIACEGGITTTSLSTGWLNLASVGGNLYIDGSPNLTNLNNLSNLKNVGNMIRVSTSPSLTDISVFSNLTFVGGAIIFDNKTYATKMSATSYICQNYSTKIYINGVGYANATTKLQVCNP